MEPSLFHGGQNRVNTASQQASLPLAYQLDCYGFTWIYNPGWGPSLLAFFIQVKKVRERGTPMKINLVAFLIITAFCAGCNNPDPYPRYGSGYTGPAGAALEAHSRAAQPSYADFNEFDRSLVNRVRETIREKPELKGVEPGLMIVSENGTVTLHGIVASAAERNAVELRARETSGVANVVNYLEITPVPAIQVPAAATGGAETP